jgi:hypothetical protein
MSQQTNERWKFLQSAVARLYLSGCSTEAVEVVIAQLGQQHKNLLATPGESVLLAQTIASMPPEALSELANGADSKALVDDLLARLPYLTDKGRYGRLEALAQHYERKEHVASAKASYNETLTRYYRDRVPQPAAAAAPAAAPVVHGRPVSQGDTRPSYARIDDGRLRYERTDEPPPPRTQRKPQRYRMGGLAADNGPRFEYEAVS